MYTTNVKRHSSLGEKLISNYAHSVSRYGYRNLRACYKKPSATKKRIFAEWAQIVKDMSATGFTIIGHNCDVFTVGFMVGNDLYYITPSQNYCVKGE